MPEFHLDKKKVPLWSGADGTITVNAAVPALDSALPVSSAVIAGAKFDVGDKIALQGEGSVSIGITSNTSLTLAPLWAEQTSADPDLVKEFALTPSLTAANLLLAIDIGGKADVTAASSFQYSALAIGAHLEAGADARLVQIRSYDRATTAKEMLTDFFGAMTLPGLITTPPPPDQVVFLEFGGYLNFGVNASAGYDLAGSHSFQFSQLKLSEKYDLSVTGKLSVDAKLAGRFSVEARLAEDPKWVSVKVRRQRSRDLTIAADVNVSASLETDGLPPSGKEFIEALMGLRATNWLNLAEDIVSRAAQIQTASDLVNSLDDLAGIYISKYVRKGVTELTDGEVGLLLGRLQNVVESYKNVDQTAIKLFDRYFGQAEDVLLGPLNQLRALTSWSQFKGELDPVLWNVVQQLTNGDPLTWILGVIPGTAELSLPALQKRVTDTLALIQDDSHKEIRTFIGALKEGIGLDGFVGELDQIDSPAKLKTLLSKEAKGIAKRVIGVAVDDLSRNQDLTAAFNNLTAFARRIKAGADGFFADFDAILKEAASQKFSFALNAAYENSNESKALIDVDIRLLNEDGTQSEAGKSLVEAAGRGDFTTILSRYDPALVRLREGDLTHNISSGTTVSINIAGWHQSFQYQEMYKVVVNSKQQIRPASAGMLNVFTTIDLSAEHDRTRKTATEQEMHSNLALRFLAETHGAATDSKFNAKDKAYLIDVVTGQTASYTTSFTNSSTTPAQLDSMLAFADFLGLAGKGARSDALAPLMKADVTGNFGPVSAEYAVRYSEDGLKRLFFGGSIADEDIRVILRSIIIANYIGAGDPDLTSVAWMYCSDELRDLALGNPSFVTNQTIFDSTRFSLTSPIPGITPPGQLGSNAKSRRLVTTLFLMEDTLIEAFGKLQRVLANPDTLSAIEHELSGFGKALNQFNGQADLARASCSPIFAVFDGLIQQRTSGLQARNSGLVLKLGPADKQHVLLFQLEAAKAAAA